MGRRGETGRDLPASGRPGRVCEGDREAGRLVEI